MTCWTGAFGVSRALVGEEGTFEGTFEQGTFEEGTFEGRWVKEGGEACLRPCLSSKASSRLSPSISRSYVADDVSNSERSRSSSELIEGFALSSNMPPKLGRGPPKLGRGSPKLGRGSSDCREVVAGFGEIEVGVSACGWRACTSVANVVLLDAGFEVGNVDEAPFPNEEPLAETIDCDVILEISSVEISSAAAGALPTRTPAEEASALTSHDEDVLIEKYVHLGERDDFGVNFGVRSLSSVGLRGSAASSGTGTALLEKPPL